MVRILNGNSELRVNEDELAAYLDKGYAVVGADGKAVKVKKAYTYAELATLCQKQDREIRRFGAYVSEAETKIAEKDAEIADLKAEISRLNKIIDAEPEKTSVSARNADQAATEGAEKKTANRAKKS